MNTLYSLNQTSGLPDNFFPLFDKLLVDHNFDITPPLEVVEWALDLQNMTNRRNIFTESWNNARQEVVTSYQMNFMPMMTYRIYF